MNAMQSSLNHGASYDWSILEAATLLYLMDHIVMNRLLQHKSYSDVEPLLP
jgi:hypothetical protein